MVLIEGLSLILTDACNASCKHCGFSAGPDKKRVMPVDQAKEYIKTIRRYKSAKLISYTGGEPFLCFDLLLELASFAADLGLYGEVVSNSAWAVNAKEAKSKLELLRRKGVIHYVTSFDEYHLEYIKPEAIKNAITAALELNYHVMIKMTQGIERHYTEQEVKRALGIKNSEVKIISQAPVVSGRAKEALDLNKIRQYIAPEDILGPCRTVIRFPAIEPEGDIYPCCGFGDQCRLLGNAQTQALAEVLSDLQNNLFYNLLWALGPYRILELSKKYIKIKPRNDFLNMCDLCNYMMQEPNVTQAVMVFLQEIAEKEKIKFS